jgi:FkbM family methyltransferase
MNSTLLKIILKIESPKDILWNKINKIIRGREIADEIKFIKHGNMLYKNYWENGIWNFNGVKLPIYKPDKDYRSTYAVYLDTLFIYCLHNDNYNSNLIDKIDRLLPEGTYGYSNKDIDVTVKKDDIVIDVGAWIGDFSAYASIKGAKVYAFEPVKEILEYLKITQKLNRNIHIVEKGLGDESGMYYISNNEIDSSSNQITASSETSQKIEVTTIDKFVKENNIDRVDFIKADIEGFERKMLLGAKETLRKYGPKLAICTYHLPDDPQVLKEIILDANPDYRIIQKNKKLYAMVVK